MPTAGEYEVEFLWIDGAPDPQHQDSVWWGNGAVCKVALGDLEVVIHVDGDTRIEDRETGNIYTGSGDFPADLNNDKVLSEASSGNYPRLDWQNNSWFDIYTLDGEHLDMVNHEADEAFDHACQYLFEQFVNICMIENNQEPQVDGYKVIVLDLEQFYNSDKVGYINDEGIPNGTQRRISVNTTKTTNSS